ncbi:MAG: Peptidoglycan-binding LysM [Pedosphaera sp.]|nr:Peptidoglycan-binding LysM [Pedosphaera sp.]
MRRYLILTISAGLNVVVLLVWLVSRHRSAQLHARPVGVAPGISNVVHTRVVVRKQFFSWQELESADYPAYVANLREIGCPEQTIRDIIIADVNQLYAKKRMMEVVTPEQQWWRFDPDPNLVQAATAKIFSLEEERVALLTTLLGPNWAATETTPATGVTLNGPILGELSPETKRAVQDAVTRSQQRTQAYLAAQQSAGKPAAPAELARLAQQMRTELAQSLNPAQLEEFLLRYSQTAASLRERLRGIDLTPDEFRNLFRSTDPLEQKFELVSGDTQAKTSQEATLAKQMEDTLKEVLGPERYKEYRTNQEPAFQQAAALADENGASMQEVRSLYELNKATLQEQARIRNDDSLTPEQKAAQLAQVDQQQKAASDRILGLAPPTPVIAPTVPAAQVHSYSPGESVDMIAAKYGVSASSILSANPSLNFHTLTGGTAINIPPPPAQ